MRGVLVAFTLGDDWWCRRLADRFSGLKVRFLNVVPTGHGRCIETVELYGPHAAAGARWLVADGQTTRGLVIQAEDDHAVVRLTLSSSPLAAIIEETGIVPQMPFTFDGRDVAWLMLGEGPEARTLLSWLEAHGIEAHTLRGGDWHAVLDDLTEHQRDVFEEAVRVGYYDSPRRMNLTLLADRLGVAKSTLSETLMVVEHKIMHAHRSRGATGQMQPAPRSHRRPTHQTASG